ncbi:N-6 DNA methylase [Patescibacteria group bacterium]|nr:N-6 DNA methylase [Patescibacteria group bacterium]
MNKQKAKQQIQKLVEKYQRVAEAGKIKSYNEAQTRNEFIEPLFELLGWDMRNRATENEVTTEENISGGRVDLAFRFGNIPVFFLEAKAMKVDLDQWKWAEQAINYSWNKSVTWAVLTDFESIKIFNAEIPPKSISQNLFIEIRCQDFINRFNQLWLLSKESFEQKTLYKEAQKWGKLTTRKQVSEKLFEDLMSWRVLLTKDFKKQNNLTDEELSEGVQRILDRLIFIRTAEDRKIEPNVLLGISRSGKANSYKQLTKVFRNFDDGYNSKLFAPHYCEEWKASDKVIGEVIKGLYETKDGYRYDFSVISADVLGGIYEQYLSFVQGRKGEEKAKSKRKSQGIYYTPKYIVEFIVKETLGEVLKKTKPKEISKIKVLDPACGSGSFLTASYDKILESIGNQSLFTKFDILKDNIYGVDLDEQAVEIAQLNLLLKVLSQKTKLPTLQHNIRPGNSLISGSDEKLEKYFGEKWREQKPFNFKEKFKEVFPYKVPKVTVDSNTNQKVIRALEEYNLIQAFYFQSENKTKKEIKMARPSFYWDMDCWDSSTEVLASDDDLDESVLKVIYPSFPKEDNRAKIDAVQRGFINDARIFAEHVRNKRDYFVSDDKASFQKHKEKLENKFNTEILTVAELVDKFSRYKNDNSYSVVIGNPPYVQLSMEEKLPVGLKEYLLETYKSSMGRLNTFGFFIRRGIDLLKDDGYLGFIIPNTILTQDYYEELRKYILDNCSIKSIISFDNLPFKDAVVENVVLVLHKTKSERVRNNHKVQIYKVNGDLSFVRDKSITQKLFLQSHKYGFNKHLDEERLELKKKLETGSQPLSNFTEINQAIALKHERAKYLSKTKENSSYKPVIDGRNIGRYFINWDAAYLKYDINVIHSCKREDIFLTEEKLFFRRVGDRLVGAYDNKQFYALNTLVVINLKENIAVNIKYILALFNSKLLNWYYQSFFKSTKKVFSEIQARQIAQLPIKILDFGKSEDRQKHDKIVSLVNNMIYTTAELQATSANTDKHNSLKREIERLDGEIDEAIYKLYGLTNKEIKTVEE